jgi:hypothetical protein
MAFSDIMNYWNQRVHIVDYEETSCLGAGSSSRSASANIAMYAWYVQATTNIP